MVRRSVLVLLTILLFPLVAAADEQIPIKSASELKGNWSGSGGFGPFGNTPTAPIDYTIKEDGTFSGVLKLNQARPFQGSIEPKPDGTAAVSSTGSDVASLQCEW